MKVRLMFLATFSFLVRKEPLVILDSPDPPQPLPREVPNCSLRSVNLRNAPPFMSTVFPTVAHSSPVATAAAADTPVKAVGPNAKAAA